MTELLAELAPEFGDAQTVPSLQGRPFQCRQGAVQDEPSRRSSSCGGYIQLSAEGLAAGSGMWMMAPDQLERYRQAVSAEATGQVACRSAVGRCGLPGSRPGATTALKTAPKGYPKDHPRIELLRYKGVTCWKQWPPGAWLGKPGAKQRLVTFFRVSRPLDDWLGANVGPSKFEHWGRH